MKGRRNHGESEDVLSEEDRLVKVLSSLYELVGCLNCGTRLRFGDLECPHCGRDADDAFRLWAERLLQKLDA